MSVVYKCDKAPEKVITDAQELWCKRIQQQNKQ